MTSIEVRAYDPADREALVAGFGAAGAGAPGGQAWGHPRSLADVYLTPYLDLEPESAFVVTADGRPAGYLVGCVDDVAFPSEDERTRRAIARHHLYLRPRPLLFFARARYDARRHDEVAGGLSDPRWPAHLHIDIEPVARGAGAGARLMELWLARLRAAGSPGCYLQTTAENTRAVAFFERMGFVGHGPHPIVPGLRHDGRLLHQQTMVRDTLRTVPVTAANAEAWREIHNTIIPASPLSAGEVAERLTRHRLTLAYDGDVLVGNATIRPPEEGSTTATVIVRILEGHRRRGHGTAYLARMLAAARGAGADRIETVVLEANADGLAFALRRGFEEVERYEVDGARYVDLALRHSSASSA